MNLPFIKKSLPQAKREYLFALEISHGQVKSAVWTVINSHPQVVSQGAPVVWDDQTDHSLLTACDTCLSDASAKLDVSGKTEINKIILGLPSDWLSGEKINPDYLKLLKLILQKLSLKAVGFVVTPDAAVRYLQTQDGVPPTAILIGIYPDILEITLVRLGKADVVQLVKRSSQIVADVTEGLSRYSQINLLPSRILLYDSGTDLEPLCQTLLSHPWQTSSHRLPFLHFPKIDILPNDFTIKAIALAGGTEVAQALGILASPSPAPATSPESSPAESVLTPEDLGFIEDEDIAKDESQAETPVSLAPVTPPPVPLTQVAPIQPPPPQIPEITEAQLPQRIHSAPKISLPRLTFLPLVLFVILFLFGGLAAAYWFLPTAQVVVTVDPKSLDHQFSLIADIQSTAPDVSSSSIPARSVEVTTTGEKSVSTTGSKIIGDKATGSVTFINGTSLKKSFPQGTVITSPAGLKFTTDSSIDVASASGTADPNSYQPGQATVKVTASQIGTDSNLSAGTQFKVGSFSSLDFVAKNDAAFSGGSSRQAQVVSRDDLNNLKSELSSQLKNDAQSQLTSQISATDTIVDSSIQLTTLSEEFNHKVDEVADSLNLKLSVKAKAIVFSKSDLDSVVTSQISSQIPSSYKLSGTPHTSFTVKTTSSQKTELTVNVSAALLPEFSTPQIVSTLKGKSPQAARDYLSTLPGVTRVEFSFKPPLPAPLLYLPHSPNNINFSVNSAQ